MVLKKKKMIMVNLLLRVFISLLVLVLVHSQEDQSGFISIDCGVDEGYTDESTTIVYTPDASYTNTGINVDIAPVYKVASLQQQFKNVRSFPQGTKNCYTLRPPQGKDTDYLVRAYFMYGNYDSLDRPPTFDLYLGVDVWDTIKMGNSSQIVVKEIIHTPSTDYLFVCLVDTGSGTPFISGLELRHLNDSLYTRQSGSLDLLYRYYTYTTSLDEIRYQDDVYDRIWEPMYLINGSLISTTSEVTSNLDAYNLPSSVMKAAIVTANVSRPISFLYTATDPDAEFYLYLHVAELSSLRAGQIREFNISVNGQHLYGPYVPLYLSADTIYTTRSLIGPDLNVSIQSTNRATLPPLLNALEIFSVKMLAERSTDQSDVEALMDIKSFYNLTKNWQGDPCIPKAYSWNGVNCSYDSSSSPRIVSLNLSSSGLTGNITTSISNLTALQVLDLSNNKLSGQIPEFLAELPLLKTLNLAGNSFSGSVPEQLQERSRKGSLSLSVGDTPDLCSSTSCSSSKKKNTFIVPVAACAGLLVLLLAGFIAFLVFRRRKKQKAMQVQVQTFSEEPAGYSKNKGGLVRFTYSEVTNMTSGFQRQLGKGGFGEVYYGCLKDGTPVAIKMLYPSINASEQFSAEVELLMAIRHKNLVSLVGYCEEETNLALIYEFMATGDLQSVLSASHSLSWKERVQIAIDAAQGLDYLHNGCRPPIVHRDVKTPNILLNKNLQAKIADFGLSKIFPDEDRSYVSTRVIGTPGYLDPEYHITQQLNEKSDVYSFGVVLLELITGKSAIVRNGEERTRLVQWVNPKLERGDIRNIVDQRLQEVFKPNSVWRATDIAMSCFKSAAVERPTMSQIVNELKECLAMELDAGNSRSPTDDSIEMRPMISFTAMDPAAR